MASSTLYKPSIQYMLPIEHISRKFIQRKKTCANNLITYSWLGAGVRVGQTKHFKANVLKRNYFVVRTAPFNLPQTSEARAARTRFATVSGMVKARKENLQTLTQDQAAFKAQVDTINGLKSFKSYLWKVCGEEYDAQYGG